MSLPINLLGASSEVCRNKKIMDEIIKKIAEELSNTLKETLQPPVEKSRYYTIEDVCGLLHISKTTLHRHRQAGYIRPTACVGRKPLFDEKAIEEYLKAFPAL